MASQGLIYFDDFIVGLYSNDEVSTSGGEKGRGAGKKETSHLIGRLE